MRSFIEPDGFRYSSFSQSSAPLAGAQRRSRTSGCTKAGLEAAFDQLSGTSAEFRRAERIASVVWCAALLGEAAVRVVSAYTLPIDTMVWLGPVILVAALVLTFRLSMPPGTEPMAVMCAEAAQKA